jgi:hypothetical protein
MVILVGLIGPPSSAQRDSRPSGTKLLIMRAYRERQGSVHTFASGPRERPRFKLRCIIRQ